MNKLKQDIRALEVVTLNRLLFINRTIRENRKVDNKVNLAELKIKRRETDKLLSKIKRIDTEVMYNQLKAEYMTT